MSFPSFGLEAGIKKKSCISTPKSVARIVFLGFCNLLVVYRFIDE